VRWVRDEIYETPPTSTIVEPQSVVIITDTTFWGRGYGVTVFRAPHLKKKIWWNEVDRELMAHYYYGRKILESQGWTLLAAVVDGRRGLTTVFKDIPVQMCHFHQLKIVTKYLTQDPSRQRITDTCFQDQKEHREEICKTVVCLAQEAQRFYQREDIYTRL
jgi:hypothetical protein